MQKIPGGVVSEQNATFTTTDKPAVIFAFYEDALAKDGWNLQTDVSTPSQRIFGWADTAPGTSYTFAVFIRSTNDKQSVVQVQLLEENSG
jgi:hypothetical protein